MSSIAIKHCIFQFFILNCYPSLQRGSSAGPFVEFLCLKVLPSLKQVTEEETRQELLQLMAEGCLCPVDSDMAVKCLEPVFNCLLVSVHGPRATNTPLCGVVAIIYCVFLRQLAVFWLIIIYYLPPFVG